MDKVYLVSTQSGSWDDFNYEVVSVCSSLESAEKEKQRIEEKIQNIKTLYLLENDSEYEKDLFKIQDVDFILENEDLYNKLTEKVYSYQFKYKDINIHTINIEERELL